MAGVIDFDISVHHPPRYFLTKRQGLVVIPHQWVFGADKESEGLPSVALDVAYADHNKSLETVQHWNTW